VETAPAYDVLIGDGALGSLADRPGRWAVVVDENVAELHGERLRSIVGARDVTWVTVGSGEAHKSLASLSELWRRFAAFRLERTEHVVAIGGGVVGDLAGFAAATWRRGVPFVQVPTTLLAQVDASVGGKVAIDHAGLKNPVGAFHQPVAVIAETAFLSTLPARERWSGLVEVVKMALLAGDPLLALVESSLDALSAGSGPIEDVVVGCVAFKAGVVSRDPDERGERASLNLGHTIGHALEAASDVRLLHGEAVASGLRAMVELAGGVDGRVRRVVDRLPRPDLRGLDRERVMQALASDKKSVGGVPSFVVCEAPGRVRRGVRFDEARVRAVVSSLVEGGS